MWRGRDWKFKYPKREDGLKDEAKESENNTEASIPPTLEGQEPSASCSSNISVKDASLDMLDTVALRLINEGVAMDKREDLSEGNAILFFGENHKPFTAIQQEITACKRETLLGDTGGMFTKFDDTYPVADESAAMLEPATMVENGSTKDELMDAVTHDKEKLQDMSEALLDCSEKTDSTASCTEALLSLLKQAIDTGKAVVLDANSFRDADIVYGKTVAFSQSAPPGPVFRRPKKAAAPNPEEKEREGLVLGKTTTSPEKSRSERKSNNRGTQITEDTKEDYLDVGTRGTLRVDELAKLLA